MVVVKKGVEGKEATFYIDGNLKKNLDAIVPRVRNDGWDYVGLITGLPGAGKSTFSTYLARYLCPWFDDTYICFTAEEFIKKTATCPEYSAVVLDESFQDMNTRSGLTSAFKRVLNHLQLIRQRHLFIFLILPNFFDLSKHVAIFRANHLFFIYEYAGENRKNRRSFIAFDRETKKLLYIKGSKYINYNAQKANFKGWFAQKPSMGQIIDQREYDRRKREHLIKQGNEEGSNILKTRKTRALYAGELYKKGMRITDLMELGGNSENTVRKDLRIAGVYQEKGEKPLISEVKM
jgi:hypothetical protein